MLLFAGVVFYLFAGVASTAIMATLIVANYGFMTAITGARQEGVRDWLYRGSMAFNVVTFVGFKLVFEPHPDVTPTSWTLLGVPIGYPLGLSFVILMLHSAVTDAYSKKYLPKGSFDTFLLFGSFFPYVTAGPVERLNHMEGALAAPARPSLSDLGAGLSLISLGLVKKLAAANRIKPYVDSVFVSGSPHSSPTMALAIILNAAYVYCDFSSYTDMARGAARCLGIDVRINFDKPFSARSVTDFWRRWHISFSTWLRDYLYMPLAFTFRRQGSLGQTLALLVTFVLCGFWHRAAITFLLFGLLHGSVLALELRFGKLKWVAGNLERAHGVVRSAAAHAYTLIFLAATIVLFSASDLAQAGDIFGRLFDGGLRPAPGELFGNQGPIMFLLIGVGVLAWQGFERWHARLTPGATPVFLLACALVILFLGHAQGGGFVYAQF